MTLKEEAQRLAVKTRDEILGGTETAAVVDQVESALLAFAKLVLEREPTDEMRRAGQQFNWNLHAGANDVYRAMTAELRKELEQ
jgi:hypothetical protein